MLGIRVPRTLDVSLMTRGVTALLVIWWHTGGYKVTHADWSFLYVPGRLAVFVFFILSGYVISYGFWESRYAPAVLSHWALCLARRGHDVCAKARGEFFRAIALLSTLPALGTDYAVERPSLELKVRQRSTRREAVECLTS